jgi:hypothetical protein
MQPQQTAKTNLKDSEERQMASLDEKVDLLFLYAIDVCLLAHRKVSFHLLEEIVLNTPRQRPAENDPITVYDEIWTAARDHTYRFSLLNAPRQVWKEYNDILGNILGNDSSENELCSKSPEYKMLKRCEEYWFENEIFSDEGTRTLVEAAFSDRLRKLLKEPLFSLFRRAENNGVIKSDEEKFDEALDYDLLYKSFDTRNEQNGILVNWKDLDAYLDFLPEYRREALQQIKKFCGGLHFPPILIPLEIAARKIVEKFKKEDFTPEEKRGFSIYSEEEWKDRHGRDIIKAFKKIKYLSYPE